ncbi:MAG TPA: gamma-glutamyl-gamma-aminobutyrate hydrolase family protein [Candidatus Dojkabacteria bacterium]|nr:gamma-glutamyl-gamma-aminobutyrate hydrolase family protein [Candidatus Dojkabacteria bacterium]
MTKKKVYILSPDLGVRGMFWQKKDKYEVITDLTHNEPDLIVFTGGADVDPSMYGEEKLPETSSNIERDNREKKIFDEFKNVPKVGICRGGQFLNVMSGGKMWQHVNNHSGNHKMINLLKTDFLTEDEITVSSTHHQMMIAGNDGHVIGIAMNADKTAGRATDYVSAIPRMTPKYDTEVVWYDGTKSLCFQGHPEYNSNEGMTNYFFKLLDHFFFPEYIPIHKVV